MGDCDATFRVDHPAVPGETEARGCGTIPVGLVAPCVGLVGDIGHRYRHERKAANLGRDIGTVQGVYSGCAKVRRGEAGFGADDEVGDLIIESGLRASREALHMQVPIWVAYGAARAAGENRVRYGGS